MVQTMVAVIGNTTAALSSVAYRLQRWLGRRLKMMVHKTTVCIVGSIVGRREDDSSEQNKRAAIITCMIQESGEIKAT